MSARDTLVCRPTGSTCSFTDCQTRQEAVDRAMAWVSGIHADQWRQFLTDILLADERGELYAQDLDETIAFCQDWQAAEEAKSRAGIRLAVESYCDERGFA